MEGRDATANCQLARSTNTARLSIMISCPLPSLIYQKRRRERERSKTRYWSRMEDDAIAARSCLLHNNTQATMTIVSLIGGCCAPWENDVDARLTDIFLISICRLDHGTNDWTNERRNVHIHGLHREKTAGGDVAAGTMVHVPLMEIDDSNELVRIPAPTSSAQKTIKILNDDGRSRGPRGRLTMRWDRGWKEEEIGNVFCTDDGGGGGGGRITGTTLRGRERPISFNTEWGGRWDGRWGRLHLSRRSATRSLSLSFVPLFFSSSWTKKNFLTCVYRPYMCVCVFDGERARTRVLSDAMTADSSWQ